MKGTITITGVAADASARNADKRNKQIIFKLCELFTNCISTINKSQVDNLEYLDIVKAMYNLKVYSDNYAKT